MLGLTWLDLTTLLTNNLLQMCAKQQLPSARVAISVWSSRHTGISRTHWSGSHSKMTINKYEHGCIHTDTENLIHKILYVQTHHISIRDSRSPVYDMKPSSLRIYSPWGPPHTYSDYKLSQKQWSTNWSLQQSIRH